jgi:hypothetical protein
MKKRPDNSFNDLAEQLNNLTHRANPSGKHQPGLHQVRVYNRTDHDLKLVFHFGSCFIGLNGAVDLNVNDDDLAFLQKHMNSGDIIVKFKKDLQAMDSFNMYGD